MSRTLTLKSADLTVTYDVDTFALVIDAGYKSWHQVESFQPYIDIEINRMNRRLYFSAAKNVVHEKWHKGFGQGIKSKFTTFSLDNEEQTFEFESLIWIDHADQDLHFEVISMKEGQSGFIKLSWPGPLASEHENGYAVIPQMQGLLIPDDFNDAVELLDKDMFCSRAFYMPWWGQIADGKGYIAIAETPWDGGCAFSHPAGGPTRISPIWYASLGKLDYVRKIKYKFLENCDYNVLCKVYRNYVKQKGELITLEEKVLKNHHVNRLIGSPVVHSFIYYHRQPACPYFDKNNPQQNDRLVTFSERARQLRRLKELGADKLYLHLDGWGKRGYDNLHPDILPPCELAGGWAGMKELADTCKELGYLFAIHDQYWDYYKDAETYDPNQTIRDKNGKIREVCAWDGGEQAYLCGHFTLHYIKRNFNTLKRHGIDLEGAYIDCLSAAVLDECFDIEHIMTRKQCLESRKQCLEFVRSEGLISSSEEPIDWALPAIDLVHHTPYSPGKVIKGIPVPLFNIVYHDCYISPWAISSKALEVPDSCFLHALLNGGIPYLGIEADEQEIDRCKIVCELHKQVAKVELLKHEFIDGNTRKWRTVYANGITVEADFDTEEYVIKHDSSADLM